MTMRKAALLLVVALIAGLLAAALWFFARTGVPPGELTELAATEGDVVLREPMRPPGAGTRVLLVALDGVGYDELDGLLRAGRLPYLGQLLGAPDGDDYEHGFVARAVSILPSTTMAAWASVYTGAPPAETGVPGNEWFAREEARFYAPAPVSIEEYTHTVRMLTDGLLGDAIRTPTLFERLDRRAFVALAPVYRGADLFMTPAPEAVGGIFLRAARGVTGDRSVPREAYSEVDEATAENLVDGIERFGVPDLQVVYFPGIDLYTHVAEDPLVKERAYLQEVTDPAIGEILRAYRDAGALDETYVVVVSDHGHTPVLEDDRHALGVKGDDEPTALLEHAGFRVRPAAIDPGDDEQDYQAVVAYQGAMAYVYLADRSTCPAPGMRCDWRRPPRPEEDVMPIAHAFHEASASGAGNPALAGTLDLVFARAPRGTDEDALPFEVYDGRALVPIADYLAANPRPDLIRLEERMEWLAAGPYGHRAGDVLLLAKSGQERPIEDRYYFSSEYRSWHGSPSPQDSYVPLLVAHPARSGRALRTGLQAALTEDLSHLDVVPLLLDLLVTERTQADAFAPKASDDR